MQLGEVKLDVKVGSETTQHTATRVRFSANQCFRFDDGPEDLECLAVLDEACSGFPTIAAAVGAKVLVLDDLAPDMVGNLKRVAQDLAANQ